MMVQFRFFFSVLVICITVLIMYFTSMFYGKNSKKNETSPIHGYVERDVNRNKYEEKELQNTLNIKCIEMLLDIQKKYDTENFGLHPDSYKITYEKAKEKCLILIGYMDKEKDKNYNL